MRDTFECVERGVMESKIIDDALDFVKEVFSTDFSGHDYFHTLRVFKTQIVWTRLVLLASHAPLLMEEAMVAVCMTQMSHQPLT